MKTKRQKQQEKFEKAKKEFIRDMENLGSEVFFIGMEE